MLHLATSFISSVVKSSIKDDEAKRGVTMNAIMVDLADKGSQGLVYNLFHKTASQTKVYL